MKIEDLDRHQRKPKITKDISFCDQNGNQEKNFILRHNEKVPAEDFIPILKQSLTGIEKYIFKNDKGINNVSENFAYGSSINRRTHHKSNITPKLPNKKRLKLIPLIPILKFGLMTRKKLTMGY